MECWWSVSGVLMDHQWKVGRRLVLLGPTTPLTNPLMRGSGFVCTSPIYIHTHFYTSVSWCLCVDIVTIALAFACMCRFQHHNLHHSLISLPTFFILFLLFSLYFRTKLSNIKLAMLPSSNNSIQTAIPIKGNSINIDNYCCIYYLYWLIYILCNK